MANVDAPVVPSRPPGPAKSKAESIHVSPAVLDAARKDSEGLLRDLRSSPRGLTQAEAVQRARTTGPNEVAQERKQGWPIRAPQINRLLRLPRHPLVVGPID